MNRDPKAQNKIFSNEFKNVRKIIYQVRNIPRKQSRFNIPKNQSM